jgi:hypothetical protein
MDQNGREFAGCLGSASIADFINPIPPFSLPASPLPHTNSFVEKLKIGAHARSYTIHHEYVTVLFSTPLQVTE